MLGYYERILPPGDERPSTGMNGYNRQRLGIMEAFLGRKADVHNGRPWTLEPRGLRFKHGETIAELKVPYHMGGEDEAVIESAILSIASLLVKRYEPKAEGRQDQTVLMLVPPVKERTFRLDVFISDSLEKRIAASIVKTTPCMDTAILAPWLGAEGHGRKFIKWTGEILEKALKEEARTGGEENTSYLALLAIINTVRKKKDKIKGLRVKGLTYEKADIAVGMTLFTAFRETVLETMSRLKASKATFYNPSIEEFLASAVVPKSFLSIPASLLSSSINPYGINGEVFELISKYAPPPCDGLEEKMSGLAVRAGADEELTSAVRQCQEIVRFREEAFAYLTEFDIPGDRAREILIDLYMDDRLIRNFLGDQRLGADLTEALEEVRERYGRDQKRADMITRLLTYVSSFRKSILGSLLKSARKEPDGMMSAIDGYYACSFDDTVEKYEGLMRSYLADRRSEFSQNMLLEEYNRGRLYRFSVDDRPVLKTLELEEEGQLFIDMKDFTRKTLKVKEIAMADFMKEHFYKPILDAASRYGAGMGVVEDERGIRLTNLPGDAAIFSGGVTYLVALARDIQGIIRRYREQLLRRLPPRKDEELLEEVHRRFEERKDALKQRRAELTKALNAGEKGLETRLVALGEEEHRLDATYRDEIEASIKGELEAGLYIAYGAKAETTVIVPKEDFSGTVKVAIGEKINESSRGTFRNSMVRAKLELLLETERAKRKNKSLKYPFDIYIDRVYSIKMPPELESAFEKLIASRKLSSAEAMTHIMANAYFNDLKKIISGETFSSLRLITSTTDIYNKGQAVSQSALEAYMKESRGSKWSFKKTVPVASLDPSIQESFFFTSDELEFWFSYEHVKNIDYIEVFYRNGEVMFKGFETASPTAIYEMLNTDGDFFKALVKYHFKQWLEESRIEAETATPVQ